MLKTLIDYFQDQANPVPRAATPGDRGSWFDAAMEAPPKSLNREQLITHLKMRNPVRMRRLANDYAWMQRELKKAGKNPEDARWLL